MGTLFVNDTSYFDFETNPSITAQILAVSSIDNTVRDTANVTVNLNDVNENPVTLTINDFNKTIYEHRSPGYNMGFMQGSVSQGTILWTILNQTPANAITILPNGTTAFLTVGDSALFNFDNNPIITATVVGTSSVNQLVKDTAVATINLTDLSTVTLTLPDVNKTIDERPNQGSSAATIIATFSDGIVFWSIANQSVPNAMSIATGGPHAFLFVEDSTLFEYDINPILTVTVVATSSIHSSITDTGIVTINLNEVIPVVLSADDFQTTIDENPTPGQILGTMQSTVNVGSVNYYIVSQNPPDFLLVNYISGIIQTQNVGLYDFEINPTLLATVEARSTTDSSVRDTAVVTITLNDVVENPFVNVVLNDTIASINENPFNGQAITQVMASVSEGTVTYSLLSQNPSGAVTLNLSSGFIFVGDFTVFDYEVNPVITAQIIATSDINPIHADTATLTINLIDLVESLSLNNDIITSINENPTNGQVIGTITGTIESGNINYFFISQSPDSALTFIKSNATDAIFSVLKPELFDYETNPIISATIYGQSQLNPAITDTAIVSITLNDLLEGSKQ